MNEKHEIAAFYRYDSPALVLQNHYNTTSRKVTFNHRTPGFPTIHFIDL